MVDDNKIWIIARDEFWASVDGKRKHHRKGRRYKFPAERAAGFARAGLLEIVPVEPEKDDSDGGN